MKKEEKREGKREGRGKEIERGIERERDAFVASLMKRDSPHLVFVKLICVHTGPCANIPKLIDQIQFRKKRKQTVERK
jgi:hypothetical protein